MNFRINSYSIIHERQNWNLMQILALAGGLKVALVFIGYLLVNFFNERAMFSSIISSVY